MSVTGPPVLEARHIRRYYGDRLALQVEGLFFDSSSITAFWGPNGAGKSTLLRILACLDHPDSGEIRLHGNKLSERGDWFRARKLVTMVDQNPYAFRGSVFTNVAFGLKARGVKKPEIEDRVERALGEVGLSGAGRQEARTLSGGELQRMAIARALVCDPQVLVLDEPTAHVDSGSVPGIEKTVAGLREQRDTSIILATHDSSQAFRIADRVLYVEDGKVTDSGSTIIDGRLERRDGRLILRSPTGEKSVSSTLAAMELASGSCILTLEPAGPRVRVSAEDVEKARPVPGEKAELGP